MRPPSDGFLRAITLLRHRVEDPNAYPYTIPPFVCSTPSNFILG
ncbi:hypothetical protein [Polyangium sp. y55x31]|nr:hypothetical protein [Polyangium sp. y55x31]MDI1480376.1 hypothetical protein [Polyangium sp. y55x31]